MPFLTDFYFCNSEKRLTSNWVTVFGFQPEHAAELLELFCELGSVISRDINSDANFIHLQYATNWDAQKALAKNGTLFKGFSMIGVVPRENVTFLV